MPLFRYTATNDDDQEVTGVIDLPTVEAARAAVEDMHIELRNIEEVSRHTDIADQQARPPLHTTFAFEGTDQTGASKRGTIQAESKYEAFEKLRQDQDLFLTMLSPLGTSPQYRDHDLENWQKNTEKPALMPTVPQQSRTSSVITSNQDVSMDPSIALPTSLAASAVSRRELHPIMSTIRLYCGWLLGWYGLFVAIGYYRHIRALPWDIPFVEAFYLSPLIFTCILAIFLVLFFSTIYRQIRGGVIAAFALIALGIGMMLIVRGSL